MQSVAIKKVPPQEDRMPRGSIERFGTGGYDWADRFPAHRRRRAPHQGGVVPDRRRICESRQVRNGRIYRVRARNPTISLIGPKLHIWRLKK